MNIQYKTAKNEPVISIQYLRGIAAMLVVFHHLLTPASWLHDPIQGFSGGAVGVDLFFVISGFVMYVAARGESCGNFLYRRIVRVVPLYWLMTAAYFFLGIYFSKSSMANWTYLHIFQSLLFIPHESPTYSGHNWPILVPGWTLVFEMFFYGLFAISLLFGRVTAILTIAIVILTMMGVFLNISAAVFETYTSPLLLEFLGGVLLGKLYQSAQMAGAWPLLAALPPLIFLQYFATPETAMAIRILLAVMAVAGVLALENYATGFPIGILKKMGDASYSIYLSHQITLGGLFLIWSHLPLKGTLQFLTFMTSGLIVIPIVGFAIHSYVEKPLTRLFRNRRA